MRFTIRQLMIGIAIVGLLLALIELLSKVPVRLTMLGLWIVIGLALLIRLWPIRAH